MRQTFPELQEKYIKDHPALYAIASFMLHLQEKFNGTAYAADDGGDGSVWEQSVPGIAEVGDYQSNITVDDVENYLHRLAVGFSFGLARLNNQQATCYDCGYGYGPIYTIRWTVGYAPFVSICLVTIIVALIAIIAEFRATGIWMGNSLMRVLVLGGGSIWRGDDEDSESELVLGLASDGVLTEELGDRHFVVGTDLDGRTAFLSGYREGEEGQFATAGADRSVD
ncbi:hypothetical protein HDV00_003321 [Rhizophlyctis rosea]|nr:hypothetical protein HDV00_003321 [Rhizophlyctis rosea]